jgi:hypothetical protein
VETSDQPVAATSWPCLYRRADVRGRPADYERLLVKYPNFSMVHKNLGALRSYLRDMNAPLSHYQSYEWNHRTTRTCDLIADLRKRTGK